MRISIKREVEIPDQLKIERYRRAPELGPSILFFSGGTALRDISRELIKYTHNSVHLITPFDSGGSSAVIRKAFHMPAVGDIRNRLMSLADQSVKGNPEIFDLFTHRLPKCSEQAKLLAELERMAKGEHFLISRIPDPMRKIIRNHFLQFLEIMPAGFDLRGASIGNLVLTAGYLSNRRDLDPVLYIFSKLVQVCGVVRPIVNKDMHLAARLQNGDTILGQHRMTGKESEPLCSPVQSLWLTNSLTETDRTTTNIPDQIAALIGKADIICYPIGSFYSSLIANLLPFGVGAAVAQNDSPKVFVPNTGHDPEAIEMSVSDQVAELRKYLLESGAPSSKDVLDFVILDTKNGNYAGGIDERGIRAQGVTILDFNLVTEQSAPKLDAKKVNNVLLSLT